MRSLRTIAGAALVAGLLLNGCTTSPRTPDQNPPANTGQPQDQKPVNKELVAPIESALKALKAMNEAGVKKDFVTAEKEFRTFREHWAVIRVKLKDVDPKLEVHIEDGAVELDVEFKKPTDQIRVYELDEETVKLGRLLSQGAELLNAPIDPALVQRDPTQDVPFNQEVRVKITLSDHKFAPNVIELDQHTKVTFEVTNTGKEVHEFELGHYAVEIEDIQPGQTKELTLVLLDAGDWEFSCHVPGHYEVGMLGTLKVKPAELKKQ